MKNPVKDKKSKYSYRVNRGGAWSSDLWTKYVLWASYRYDGIPSSRTSYVGFRIVKNGKKK